MSRPLTSSSRESGDSRFSSIRLTICKRRGWRVPRRCVVARCCESTSVRMRSWISCSAAAMTMSWGCERAMMASIISAAAKPPAQVKYRPSISKRSGETLILGKVSMKESRFSQWIVATSPSRRPEHARTHGAVQIPPICLPLRSMRLSQRNTSGSLNWVIFSPPTRMRVSTVSAWASGPATGIRTPVEDSAISPSTLKHFHL